jgi:membrane-associated phospholipid phosphatase
VVLNNKDRMKTKMLSFALGLLLFTNFLSAQVFDKIGNDFNDFLKTGGDYFTAPLHFESNDWRNAGIAAAIVGSGFLLDNTARSYSQQNHSNFKDDLFDIDQYYTTKYVVIATAGIYGFGLFANNDGVRNLGVQLGESVIYAGAVTVTLKSLIGRSRPYKNQGHTDFKPFTINNDNLSFPSGHATLAFAFSTVMAHQIDNIFWRVGWFGAATLVSYARLYHNEHWASDVLMGGAIGYFTGRFVVNHSTNNQEDKGSVEKEDKPFYSVGINFRDNQPVYTFNVGYQF